MEKLKKVLFGDIEIFIASILFSIMLAVILVQVLLRVLGSGLTWAEEISRYLMIWGCCLGISAGVKHRVHVGIDAIVDHVPFKISFGIRILMDILGCVVFLFVFVMGCLFTGTAIKSCQLMPALRQPIWLVYLAFPVGFGLSALRQIQIIIQAFKNPKGRCGLENEVADSSEEVQG